MSQLNSVFEALDQVKQQEAERQAAKDANHQALKVMQMEATTANMRRILEGLGLEAEIVNGQATVEGFTFSIINPTWPSNNYYPLVSKHPNRNLAVTPENMMPDPLLRCFLVITSDLAEEYRQRRADGVNTSYAEWHRRVEIKEAAEGSLQWLSIAAEVAQDIQYLQKEIAEAPERKQRIEAQVEENRKAEVERRAKRQAAEEADRQAEIEQHQQWEREETARREREVQLRAEVAAKFGVSAEAFDYLIDALAVELRRREDCYYNE